MCMCLYRLFAGVNVQHSASELSAAPVRLATLGGDGSNADANSEGKGDETATPATPPSAGKRSSSAAGGDDDGASTTPLGKRTEEGGHGRDARDGGAGAPSPTKAHKGSRWVPFQF